tara:strand:+ start:182 stop:1024 length:843 start_codon:yes stop_codon:yes gene_type:complete
MTLFSSVLPPHKMVDLYQEQIDLMRKIYQVPSKVMQELHKQMTDRHYYGFRITRSADDDVRNYLMNLRQSHPSNDDGQMLAIKGIADAIKHIREFRKDARGETYNVEDGKLVSKELSKLELRMMQNDMAFLDTMRHHFPKAYNNVKIKKRRPDKNYQAHPLTDHFGETLCPPYTWKWKVQNQGLDCVESGKRKYLVMDLKSEPKDYLVEEGIESFKATLVDFAFKRRGTKFEPEVHSDWWVLRKKTMEDDLVGVGKDIHSAYSLIERRYNSRATSTLLGD